MKKDETSARELFREVYNGERNFMTPNHVRSGWIASGRYAYEISKGDRLRGGVMYGVTILSEDGKKMHDLNGAAYSEAEVEVKLQAVRNLHL